MVEKESEKEDWEGTVVEKKDSGTPTIKVVISTAYFSRLSLLAFSFTSLNFVGWSVCFQGRERGRALDVWRRHRAVYSQRRPGVPLFQFAGQPGESMNET